MSDHRPLLCDLAERLFSELGGAGFGQEWQAVHSAGFSTLLVDAARGGFGGDWGDFFAVMRLVGYHALSLPLGETMLAASALNASGLDIPDGALAIAIAAEGKIVDGAFSGTLSFVPWGGVASHVVADVDGRLICAATRAARCTPSLNAAGEPRDTLLFDRMPVATATYAGELRLGLALCRVAQAAGAIDHILEMSVSHANDRIQFGKPLAKLQAVQQNLAILAIEAAAVNCAGQAAAAACDADHAGDGAAFEIAAAKLRTNLAIGVATSIGHQIHGAIGFTKEYGLHPLSRRLLGWRSEAGNDHYWAARLGKSAASLGGSGLWAEITRRADRG